jgi:DNA-binding response OmpR family regulator
MSSSPDVADHPARILIVDDERHNRQLLEVMLAPEGFHLLTAASAAEALAMVAQQPPDLILLDIMMPGMDGYQVAGKIKDNLATKNIPIIMVTALDDRKARMLGLSAGAEDLLTKPVDRAELCMRVRNLLRLKAYGEYYDKYSQILEREIGSRTADLVESERLYRSTRPEAIHDRRAPATGTPSVGKIMPQRARISQMTRGSFRLGHDRRVVDELDDLRTEYWSQ